MAIFQLAFCMFTRPGIIRKVGWTGSTHLSRILESLGADSDISRCTKTWLCSMCSIVLQFTLQL